MAKTATKKVETKDAPAERVIKAGGKKGEAIVLALTKDPSLTRAQLAERIGATVGRVGEVVRYLATHGTKEEQALIEKHRASQPARKTAEKTANPTPAARGTKASKTTAAKPAAKTPAQRKATRATKAAPAVSTPEA